MVSSLQAVLLTSFCSWNRDWSITWNMITDFCKLYCIF